MRASSPLRYPGGKWRLAPLFARLISENFSAPPHYVEPYAGGASLALTLLQSNTVSRIYLNDLDPAIYAFWFSVLKHNKELCHLVQSVAVTPREWRRQKKIYTSGLAAGRLALGFATFFLNRTNHSGILNGGMIGGKQQKGEWKLDARFNRTELVRRIKAIYKLRHRIRLSCLDATEFLRKARFTKRTLAYLDPPYFQAGRRLYLNFYEPEDHALVKNCATGLRCSWVVSYDDVPEMRKLYRDQSSRSVQLLHTARSARLGREVMFFSRNLRIPDLANSG